MGGIGCAISISAALLIGQGLIMNIYYHRIQKLNMIEFWKQILRTSYILVIIGSLFYILCNYFITITDYIHLCLFSFIYFFIYWIIAVCVCMNNYERNLVVKSILSLINFHRM